MTATTSSSATPTATATATGTPTPAATPTPVTAQLKIKPSPEKFGKVKVGKVKTATLTLMNQAKKGAPITFGVPMAMIPASSPDFSSSATTCGAQLMPKKKCKLKLRFRPDAVGSKSATLTIFDNAGNANQTISLSGKGG